jgi:tetratricopeptide (TPR) repeat protein
MKILKLIILLPISVLSQIQNNSELEKMYEEDQNSRMTENIDWIAVSKNDSIREKRVYELINLEKITTGKDYFHSAMIFQHGKDSVAYDMAVKHMKKAIELDSAIDKWLLAAAIDRALMSKKKPQIYGTQYVKKNGINSKWELYQIDTTKITDEERKLYRVETIAEQKITAHNLNIPSINEFYTKSKSISKTLEQIKIESKKGINSDYNVSEQEINILGYEIMNSGKAEDALSIFMLNTELYPNNYNTYDSLGECYLKLKNKNKGILAYKKALELNPKSTNAIKVLAELK